MDFASLLERWRARRGGDRDGSPAPYRATAERVLSLGEPLVAFDIARSGLERHPGDLRLRQLMALALARSGATRRAYEELVRLRDEGRCDEETLGLLARTCKDLAAQAATPGLARSWTRRAYATYREAYRRHGGTYAGINAATLAVVLKQEAAGRPLARKVQALCLLRLSRLTPGSPEAYWLHATLGEAALILRDWDAARGHYARAAALGRGRYADIASTRGQARLLLRHLNADPAPIASLTIPRVVVFSGHMIDRPGRPRPRFPKGLEPYVRAEIRQRLEALDAGIGYASAACGSDILFLEEMLRRGGEIRIVLPTPQEDFRKASVDIGAGRDWGRRFDRLLKRAAQVSVANTFASTPGPVAYQYANLLLDGGARLRAQTLDTGLAALAVWDGRTGDGPGGTESLVRHWRSRSQPLEVIALDRARKGGSSARRPAAARPAQRIVAMLFADAVGFSKLREEQIPLFSEEFLGEVGKLTARSRHKPVVRNTWGDALYFVFLTVADAGRYALELSEAIGAVRWRERGLPGDLNFRIGLHAGPVFPSRDPVTGRPTFIGTHVSGTARIEPITPPGQVYASSAFAALAAAEGAAGFRCEYVGQVPLAKKYGTFPLYHLRRQ